jgi:hypothetical protein
MAAPRMFIVAGPPGGGKSSFFTLPRFVYDNSKSESLPILVLEA